MVVPSPPAETKAVPDGSGGVMVSWSGPDSPQGRVTQYTVHWGAGGHARGKKVVDGDTRHFNIQNIEGKATEVR